MQKALPVPGTGGWRNRLNELEKLETREPGPNDPSFHLGQWLGRREAFSLIAGRCSAAEAEIMRHIHDEKLYQAFDSDWEHFCRTYLNAPRRSVDREIGYLRKYGPAFFTLRQITHVTIKEYQSIAAHVGEDGVKLDGAVIALHAQNRDQLAAAIEKLLECAEPAPSDPCPDSVPFEAWLKRCRGITRQLRCFSSLDAEQRLALTDAVAEIRSAAAGHGAVIWDRR